MSRRDPYLDFLRAKAKVAEEGGFVIDDDEINPLLKPHQRAIVRWMVRMGRAACFAAFGLGKSVIQLEVMRLILQYAGGMGLLTIQLNGRTEFAADVEFLNTGNRPEITDEQREQLRQWQEGRPERLHCFRFIRTPDEVIERSGLYFTNYEPVRDGKLDPREFTASSLDEASCLRGFGGTKTFREFMALFAGDDRRDIANRKVGKSVRYRFVATATPSPNEYIELLAYAAYLGIMDVGQAKTRFFKRNSEKADELIIHPHKEEEFWLWVASWGLFVQQPSDLGFQNDGYALPKLNVIYHEVPVDHTTARPDKHGQGQLFREALHGIVDAAREKRDTTLARVGKAASIIAAAPYDHWAIWHDLEAERKAIEATIPGVVAIYGDQDLDIREEAIIDFKEGRIARFAAKPVMAGSGGNYQRHCHKAVYVGIGHKFNDFIQSIHRIYRFLQTFDVEIHIVYAESERSVLHNLQAKWARDTEQRKKMSAIIQQYQLSSAALTQAMTRSLGVERIEVSGANHACVNNDCVLETRRMAENSVGLIVTSIPFSTQYEYSPNYADFGHSDSNGEFFKQMDFLTPELLRVLQPGRIAAIHVKDRIVPGGINKLGFQTVYPFHVDCINHYQKHGFAYMGMKTIVTDVVRENNQTYRLGWTEQCKDGSKMGCGMPEYLLLFRKPPSSTERSYADLPVVKSKERYTRSRWQTDAHGFTRSDGNRVLNPQDLLGMPHEAIFKVFRDFYLTHTYDFEHHVRIGEELDAAGMLPSTFMLLQPPSWHPDVWTDVARMLTLNGAQSAKGKEMHLCPIQFDIVDRAIEQFTMPGETVLDPFGGLMTVPYRAVKLGRRGIGIELNSRYFLDGVAYCEMAEREMSTPSLFDFDERMAA